MRDLLEQLSQIILNSVEVNEKQNPGFWYLIPNQITNIGDRNFNSAHPCLYFKSASINSGFAEIWIRSTSLPGEFPELLPHKAHIHKPGSNCPLDLDAAVNVKLFKRIPATYLTRLLPRCIETDQPWLRTFQRCLLFTPTLSKNHDS